MSKKQVSISSKKFKEDAQQLSGVQSNKSFKKLMSQLNQVNNYLESNKPARQMRPTNPTQTVQYKSSHRKVVPTRSQNPTMTSGSHKPVSAFRGDRLQ